MFQSTHAGALVASIPQKLLELDVVIDDCHSVAVEEISRSMPVT